MKSSVVLSEEWAIDFRAVATRVPQLNVLGVLHDAAVIIDQDLQSVRMVGSKRILAALSVLRDTRTLANAADSNDTSNLRRHFDFSFLSTV